jgi:hypothetical protein
MSLKGMKEGENKIRIGVLQSSAHRSCILFFRENMFVQSFELQLGHVFAFLFVGNFLGTYTEVFFFQELIVTC